MALQPLTLTTVDQVDDGKIAKMFNKLLHGAVEDCCMRPSTKKAREVHLIVYIEPKPDTDTGICDECEVQFKLKNRVPERKSNAWRMGCKPSGKIFFNASNPESIAQMTLDEQNGRKIPPDQEEADDE